jgi:lysozyme family protein
MFPINGDTVKDFALSILPPIRFINGTVIDSVNKTGIAGAKVLANSSLKTTNALGFYSFAVASGTYNINATFEPAYYTNSSITVSTIGEAVVWQDIEVLKKPVGNITGSVTGV